MHWAAVSGKSALMLTLIASESDRLAAAAAASELAGEDAAEAPADETPADQTPLAQLQAGSKHILFYLCVVTDCWANSAVLTSAAANLLIPVLRGCRTSMATRRCTWQLTTGHLTCSATCSCMAKEPAIPRKQ